VVHARGCRVRERHVLPHGHCDEPQPGHSPVHPPHHPAHVGVGRWRTGMEDERVVRHRGPSPTVFSAANTLAPLQPICPAAGRLLAGDGFRPVPTLTNSDPPEPTRVRRLAHVTFNPKTRTGPGFNADYARPGEVPSSWRHQLML